MSFDIRGMIQPVKYFESSDTLEPMQERNTSTLVNKLFDLLVGFLIQCLFIVIGVLLIGTLIPYELACIYLLKIKPYKTQ